MKHRMRADDAGRLQQTTRHSAVVLAIRGGAVRDGRGRGEEHGHAFGEAVAPGQGGGAFAEVFGMSNSFWNISVMSSLLSRLVLDIPEAFADIVLWTILFFGVLR